MPFVFARKGGPLARLSFCLLLCARPVLCEGDPFEDALGIDYSRQLLPTPVAPRPAVGTLPGFSGSFPFAPGMTGGDEVPGPQDVNERPARLTATATLWQRDLIRRDAHFSFSHHRSDDAFGFLLTAIPGVELRFAADRDARELSIGDTAVSANLDGTDWGWRAALSFPLTPFLIPSVVVGARSSDPAADALEALAFRGAAPIGLSWSCAWGRIHRDYPVDLKLPGYASLSLPFLLRQDFAEAGLDYSLGPWDLSWSGRRTWARPPSTRPVGYSLEDSGAVWQQETRAAYARGGFAAALDLGLGGGHHVFRGLTRKDGTLYPFSWQGGEQADYSVRTDVSMAMRKDTLGAWLAAGESEYDALRPDNSAYGRWFWDRNGVVDSYQGSLLGLFSGETWLLNGAAYAGHAGLGLWWRYNLAGFAYRFSAGYQYLILEANSHLTRRRTEFLLGYSEANEDRIYPTVEADLIPLSAELFRAWGNFSVTFGGQAVLPSRVRIERAGGTGGGGGSGADYRGGTVAGIRLGYRLP
ncbi:MAG: hypothetical protein JF616_16040 [Fibrobacteres bacterium]|nr:hypothetical protein [Fibrobacterota bacterium]